MPDFQFRLDLGCGSNKRQDNGPWIGVDSIAFPGVDVVCNLVEPIYDALPIGAEWMAEAFERKTIGYKPWPWKDNTIVEAHTSHFVEHLTSMERVHFCNELYRVLVPGGKCQLIVPHWASCRAYGDPSHQWPAMSEFWFYYLKREWRLGDPVKGLPGNAPHTDATYLPGGFSCNFGVTWGYSVHPQLQVKSQDTQQFAFAWHKEAIQDLIATLVKE